MQAVLLTFKYFQCADKNKLQQQGSFTQIFICRLKSDSWFRLAGGCQELLGPQTALCSLLHGDHCQFGAGEGATHMRAVGVNERTGCQEGPGCGLGQGLRRQRAQVVKFSTTPASASSRRLRAQPALAANMCPHRARAGTSTCPDYSLTDAKQPCCINEPFVAQHTVPTDWTVTVMQREIKWLCPGSISAWFWGQTRHFRSITSLLRVFPHYHHHHYLSDHHYFIHYFYHIITYFSSNDGSILIITSVITQLLLIITSVITLLLLILPTHYYLLLW